MPSLSASTRTAETTSGSRPDRAAQTVPSGCAPDPEHIEATTDDRDLVSRHLRGVFRFARHLGADRELAADLTQEAFAIAWQNDKSRIPDQALARYLRRTARNLWLQHHRGEQRREAAIAAATERLFEDEDDATCDARIARTRDCVHRLEGRAEQAVLLRYRDELGREEIATALGMTPNGVKTLLSRTRRWLQRCIERAGS